MSHSLLYSLLLTQSSLRLVLLDLMRFGNASVETGKHLYTYPTTTSWGNYDGQRNSLYDSS